MDNKQYIIIATLSFLCLTLIPQPIQAKGSITAVPSQAYTNQSIRIETVGGNFGAIEPVTYDLGNGDSITKRGAFTYKYEEPGKYKIEARGVNTTVKIINRKPKPNLTIDTKNIVTGKTIKFNASKSYDPDGNITKYTWFWNGKENFSIKAYEKTTSPIAVHTFNKPGEHKVTLKIYDEYHEKEDFIFKNSEATITKTFTVKKPQEKVNIKENNLMNDEIRSGEKITVKTIIENKGNVKSKYNIKLSINNNSKINSGLLNVGKTANIETSITVNTPGKHKVKINDKVIGYIQVNQKNNDTLDNTVNETNKTNNNNNNNNTISNNETSNINNSNINNSTNSSKNNWKGKIFLIGGILLFVVFILILVILYRSTEIGQKLKNALQNNEDENKNGETTDE